MGKKKHAAGAAAAAAAPAAAPAAADPQKLSQGDEDLMKAAYNASDRKKYKKVVRLCDMVLKHNVGNGEALAMKGLALTNMRKVAEGWELARQGVRKNPHSCVTWHVLGLLHHKKNKEYAEAAKCYARALKADSKKTTILNDLSIIQLYRKEYASFAATRHRLLQVEGTDEVNWIAYIVGLHLAGQNARAVAMLDTYRSTIGGRAEEDTYATNELLMYRLQMVVEQGDAEESLRAVEASAELVRDTLSIEETKGDLLLQLGRTKDAEEVFRRLLRENENNVAYHHRLWRCLGHVSSDEEARRPPAASEAALAELYAGRMAEEFPRCALVRRLPLTFLTGDAFRAAADAYLRDGIVRGVPSLFRDVAELYDAPWREETLHALVSSYVENLEAGATFGGAGDGEVQPPSALLWSLYFVAQHHDLAGRHADALAAADRAIEHTPTTIDAHVLRANILRHAGDHEMSYRALDRARRLDLADRYLNVETVKCALRCGRIDDARQKVLLFLRDDEKLSRALNDLQMAWYQLEAADMHRRNGDLGSALRLYTSVDKHHDVVQEDQMEFFYYCWRRTYVRAVDETARWCHSGRNHRWFAHAAGAMIEIHLALHEDPEMAEAALAAAQAATAAEKKRKEGGSKAPAAAEAAAAEPAATAADAASDGKSARQKKKAAYREAQKREMRKLAADVGGGQDGGADDDDKKAGDDDDDEDEDEKVYGDSDEEDEKVDVTAEEQVLEELEDAAGAGLLAVKNKLGEAVRLVRLLEQFGGDRVETHVLSMRVHLARGRPLLAVRALRRARRIVGADDPRLHAATVRLLAALEAGAEAAKPAVAEVVALERADLGLGAGAEAYAREYAAGGGAAGRRLVAAAALAELGADGWAAALDNFEACDSATHEAAADVVALLRKHGRGGDADALVARCAARFPLCPSFMDEARLAERARAIEAETKADTVAETVKDGDPA